MKRQLNSAPILNVYVILHLYYQTWLLSNGLSKSHSLNHHLESHLHKNRFLYPLPLHSPTAFLNSVRTLESHSRLLFLASEKSGIEDGYIWMTI